MGGRRGGRRHRAPDAASIPGAQEVRYRAPGGRAQRWRHPRRTPSLRAQAHVVARAARARQGLPHRGAARRRLRPPLRRRRINHRAAHRAPRDHEQFLSLENRGWVVVSLVPTAPSPGVVGPDAQEVGRQWIERFERRRLDSDGTGTRVHWNVRIGYRGLELIDRGARAPSSTAGSSLTAPARRPPHARPRA